MLTTTSDYMKEGSCRIWVGLQVFAFYDFHYYYYFNSGNFRNAIEENIQIDRLAGRQHLNSRKCLIR